MDKASREIIDAMHRKMIDQWKNEMNNPLLLHEEKDRLQYLIKGMEEDLLYTYSSAKLRHHTMVVRHLRTEPRQLVWEETQMFFVRRWWRKLTIWLDWRKNK